MIIASQLSPLPPIFFLGGRGLPGLAEQLCGVEELWHREDGVAEGGDASLPGLDASLGQLDLLLQEIRQDQQP